MTVRPILRWPDPRLSQVCAPVDTVTDAVRSLAADMLETMYAAPGRGLAAPQVGVLLRLFVMDPTWREGDPRPLVVLNPSLSSEGDELLTNAEGCLSLPGILAEVTRPAAVRMRWTGLDGAPHEARFTGFGAICVQHEADHLDGVVTLDHLTAATRSRLEAEYSA